jgi:hypothetical protein
MPLDGASEECITDDLPQPLPFPSCAGSLKTGHAALEALEDVTFSFEKLAAALDALGRAGDDEGPRAA